MEPVRIELPEVVVDLIVARTTEAVRRQLAAAPEPWVGIEEAALHLACKRQRVYDLVSRRASSGIPHRKEGARLLFRLSELDRWVESGRAA